VRGCSVGKRCSADERPFNRVYGVRACSPRSSSRATFSEKVWQMIHLSVIQGTNHHAATSKLSAWAKSPLAFNLSRFIDKLHSAQGVGVIDRNFHHRMINRTKQICVSSQHSLK
jgi:hypothetical protein